jgi:hypothetical protein
VHPKLASLLRQVRARRAKAFELLNVGARRHNQNGLADAELPGPAGLLACQPSGTLSTLQFFLLQPRILFLRNSGIACLSNTLSGWCRCQSQPRRPDLEEPTVTLAQHIAPTHLLKVVKRARSDGS